MIGLVTRLLTPRVAAVLSSLLLLTCFFFPLWRIELYAPQYPEGLTMYIWVNKIGGEVDSVNLLNHYIGMKKIDALSIPELVFMPKVLLGLIALALPVAILGKRWLWSIWYSLFALIGTLGLWDFYRWGYDYGHHLNPEAPIKIPGMNYQPPLIGMKEILNITSYSLPDWGGCALAVIGVIGLFPILRPWLKKTMIARVGSIASIALAAIAISACSSGKPQPIQVGQDACHHCKMTISDARFGAEAVLKTGKVMTFDSIDCLLGYYRKNQDRISQIYLSDFFSPGKLIRADNAYFATIDGIRGPMGSSIVAAADPTQLEKIMTLQSGTKKEGVRRWSEVSKQSPHAALDASL
jgi:copper chaperone NosL